MLEAGGAVRAQAVVTVEVVDNEAVDAATDANLRPRLEHVAPLGVIETAPVFLHAANAVVLARPRSAVGVLLEQFHRVLHGPWAKLFLVPEVAVELEEAGRPF